MTLNCKPGQLAAVVRLPHALGCAESALGAVVKTNRLARAQTIYELVLETFDGQLWELENPVHCKKCSGKLFRLPDRMLRPFDDDSKPKADEASGERPMLHGAKVLTGGLQPA